MGTLPSQQLCLAELLADLSLVTDLGMGHEPESAMRTCLVATGLARGLALPEAVAVEAYYTALLLHLGCTASAHEMALAFGDDIAVNAAGMRTTFTDPKAVLTTFLPGIAQGASPGTRLRLTAVAVTRGRRLSAASQRANCEVAASTARRLGLPASVQAALAQAFEWWNGRGRPRRLAGDQIAVPARLAHVAATASLFHQLGGQDAALAAVHQRSGGYLDPAIAAAFARHGRRLLADLGVGDVRAAVVEAEPEPRRLIGEAELDEITAAFGDLVDLKSPFLLGHARGVAEVAAGAARELRMDAATVAQVRRAALLHDLGRAGVPSGIWDKPGPLTTSEWERVRLHAYHSERILARSPALAPLGRLVGLHHERQDGSGYHRQAAGHQLPLPARVLAAADVWQALGQARPYRPALPSGPAAAELREQARRGRLDSDAVAAVLVTAGQGRRRRRSGPAGLTEREVQVLRLVAAGCSTPEIARRLVIAPKTADHHVEHIYAKIGVSSRAAAALFAMEHGLLPDAGGGQAKMG
jgi:HD-GYP domain-containing protein (c-di-GMP phosphodiesterase class II)/DNA-binding CsgD family transcriptional regulator